MNNIPQQFSHRNINSHSTQIETVRRRLAALAHCATHVQPTVMGWAVLHSAWRELAPACDQAPELLREWCRVDALLGGHVASPCRNVKGASPSANCSPIAICGGIEASAETLDRQPPSKLVVAGRHQPDGMPSGERVIGGHHA